MCCYNDTADFAGSGSKATAGGVGKARTALNHDTYFNYARNYGSGWQTAIILASIGKKD